MKRVANNREIKTEHRHEIKIDASELNNTETRLLKIARSQYETKQYELALNTLSKAMSVCQSSSHFLFHDLQSAIKLDMGKLVGARRHARAMVDLAPFDPRGYLRLGKTLVKCREIEQACELYSVGYKKCPADHPMKPLLMKLHRHLQGTLKTEQAQKRRDPAAMLPPEIFCSILLLLGVNKRLHILRVSKRWRDIILKTPMLWHHLDWFVPAVPPAYITVRYPESFLKSQFSLVQGKVPKNVVIKCLGLGQYATRVLTLDVHDHLVEAHIVKESPRLRKLEVLHLPGGDVFGQQWAQIGGGGGGGVINLKHLSLGTKPLPLSAIRNFLRNLKFLESIECCGVSAEKQSPGRMVNLTLDSEPLHPLPRLRRLWLGRSIIRGWLSPNGLGKPSVLEGVSEDDIADIIKVAPNLEELSLRLNLLRFGMDGCYTGLRCLSSMHNLKAISLLTWVDGQNDYARLVMGNLPKSVQALWLTDATSYDGSCRPGSIRIRPGYGVKPLAICPNLEYLALQGMKLNREECEFLHVNGSTIRNLDFYMCRCPRESDTSLSQIVASSCDMTKLQGLHLDSTVIGDDDLRLIAGAMTVPSPPLQILTLSETGVTGVGVLTILSKAPHLKWLGVSHCDGIRPDTMDYIRKLGILLKGKNI